MIYFIGLLVIALAMSSAALANRVVHSDLRLVLVAQAAIMGIGAYSYAIIASLSGSAIFALTMSGLLGSGVGFVVIQFSRILVRDDFALFSFALQTVFFSAVTVATPVTGGVLGIPNVLPMPMSNIVGRDAASLAWILAAIASQAILLRLYSSWEMRTVCRILGRSRELAETLNLPSRITRGLVGSYTGLFMAVSGAVFAAHLSFIQPDVFSTQLSVLVLALVFFSSTKGLLGLVVAVVLIVVVPELLRLGPVGSSGAAAGRELLAGALVCVFALWRGGQARSSGDS